MAQHNESESFDQHYQRLAHAEGLPFSDLLTPARVARATAEVEIKFRGRVYTPTTVLWTFLSQVLSKDHSCLDAVARLLAWRVSKGLPGCSTNTASYCVARQQLPVEVIQQLVRQGAADHEARADPDWLWHRLHVKIVDGTTATMPDTPENQAQYPQSRNQPEGVGFPIV